LENNQLEDRVGEDFITLKLIMEVGCEGAWCWKKLRVVYKSGFGFSDVEPSASAKKWR
jgi:hypothetical protein